MAPANLSVTTNISTTLRRGLSLPTLAVLPYTYTVGPPAS